MWKTGKGENSSVGAGDWFQFSSFPHWFGQWLVDWLCRETRPAEECGKLERRKRRRGAGDGRGGPGAPHTTCDRGNGSRAAKTSFLEPPNTRTTREKRQDLFSPVFFLLPRIPRVPRMLVWWTERQRSLSLVASGGIPVFQLSTLVFSVARRRQVFTLRRLGKSEARIGLP